MPWWYAVSTAVSFSIGRLLVPHYDAKTGVDTHKLRGIAFKQTRDFDAVEQGSSRRKHPNRHDKHTQAPEILTCSPSHRLATHPIAHTAPDTQGTITGDVVPFTLGAFYTVITIGPVGNDH